MEPVRRISRAAWRGGSFSKGERAIPEEAAVAFTYNGSSYAVMMATPKDLEDFAYGFSLTEAIIASAGEIERFEIAENELGVDIQIWLSVDRGAAFMERKRRLAGPTGCGLCGLESLQDAMRFSPVVRSDLCVTPNEIMRALDALAPVQIIHRDTHAVHAAAFWQPGNGMIAIREDVGRHNALDKLAGALACDNVPAREGFLIFTSRVSIEMVQKAAMIGAPLIVAISAPTSLAVRTAEAAGITLAAIARTDGFEIFTHPDRIIQKESAHVA